MAIARCGVSASSAVQFQWSIQTELQTRHFPTPYGSSPPAYNPFHHLVNHSPAIHSSTHISPCLQNPRPTTGLLSPTQPRHLALIISLAISTPSCLLVFSLTSRSHPLIPSVCCPLIVLAPFLTILATFPVRLACMFNNLPKSPASGPHRTMTTHACLLALFLRSEFLFLYMTRCYTRTCRIMLHIALPLYTR
jgi:hypothetical protein